MRFLNVILSAATIASFASCKPRRSEADLKEDRKMRICPAPNPASYLISPYPGDSANLQLVGDVDSESANLVKGLLAKEKDPPNITNGPLQVMHLRDDGSFVKTWLLAAVDNTLFIYQGTAQGFNLKYRIKNLLIHKIFVSPTSDRINFISGKDSNESVSIGVSSFGYTDVADKTDYRLKWLDVRDKEIQRLGAGHQMTWTRGMNEDAFKGLEGGKVSGFSFGRDRKKDAQYNDSWAGILEKGQLPYSYFKQDDDFKDNSATTVLLAKSTSINFAERYYAGRSTCKAAQGGSLGNCEIAISTHSANNEKGPSERILYRKKITKSDEGNPEIYILAVSSGTEPKIAFADFNGIHVLTWDLTHGYRLKKSFLTKKGKVVKLAFFQKAESETNRDRLIVGIEDNAKVFSHFIIELDHALGPLTIGKHDAGPRYPPDWRFSDFRNKFQNYKKIDKAERAAYWDKMPIDDARAVYAAEFAPDCQSVITGGSEGKIKVWDIRSLPEVARTKGDAPAIEFGAPAAHSGRITHLSMSKVDLSGDAVVPPKLLSASLDGQAKVWSVNAELLAQFPKPEAEKLGPITAASFMPNEDAIVVVAENQPPKVLTISGETVYAGLDARSLESAIGRSEKRKSFASLAPFPGINSLVGRFLARYNDPDSQAVQFTMAYSTQGGGLFASDLKNGGHGQILMTAKANELPYIDLILTDLGQWIIAARADGIIERFYNPAIDRYSASVPDPRCPGTKGGQRLFYKKHKGAVLGVANFTRTHDDDAPLEDKDGVLSAGMDGTLVAWSLLDRCDAAEEKDPNSWYDNKLLNVYSSDHALTSLAVSADSNFAVTGTLDGLVLLWWIGQEVNLDQ